MDLATARNIEIPKKTVSAEPRPPRVAIGKLLVEAGCIRKEDVERIDSVRREKCIRFGEAAVLMGLAKEEDVLRALSRQFAFDWVSPTESRLSKELSVLFDPFCREAEALRTIRGQLLLRWFDSGRKQLAVCSPHRRSGCSHVSANLAVLFAQLGMRTLLIDANFRQPRLDELFALAHRSGLADVLAGRAKVDVFQRVSQVANLWVVPAGPIPPNPQELLARQLFFKVLQYYQRHFDIILIDTPSYDMGADLELVASRVGGALVVARNSHTKLKVVKSLQSDLVRSGVTLCGGVLNEY
ncbi:chain length determinant protein tyrosine kinase EpsG [Chitinivorax tropicus]|uniref:Chain length determinant protein tyrosine kinase EpsG n=1 Tax=Chitinivorax tropicus TaxID=714531 RepID=A0A840MS34_9PROT|nr:polysaccharide biosynthesis tyrosine autokinase [Chitinivorax tropicus]MBB5019582.1 chain length determinant protein tyrosine kinase EpsG [Chitinivorax tropicus]